MTYLSIQADVPHGSIVFSIIFKFFVSNYLNTAELRTTSADDVHAAYSTINPQNAADALGRKVIPLNISSQIMRDTVYV